MSESRIMRCTCIHETQDKEHGKGYRLFNACKPKDPQKYFRCTVCKKEIVVSK